MRTFMLCLLALMAEIPLHAQRMFTVTLHFPPDLDPGKLYCTYDDGLETSHLVDVADSTVTIHGPLHTRYATIYLSWPDSSKPGGSIDRYFWVGEEPGVIRFLPSTGARAQDGPLKNREISHVIDVNELGEDEMERFSAPENQAVQDFKNPPRLQTAAENVRMQELEAALHRKQMAFMRQHPADFYSIWLFRKEVAFTADLPTTEVKGFFESVFPDSLKTSGEGLLASKMINARINAREGRPAPDFTATDVKERVIKPEDYHGKFVLLDFWASWCGPCKRITPWIKKLRKRYPSDKLAIISFAIHDEHPRYDSMVKASGIRWTEVCNDLAPAVAYDVQGIPSVFLISPDGKILYSLQQRIYAGKPDDRLVALTAILDKQLEKKPVRHIRPPSKRAGR